MIPISKPYIGDTEKRHVMEVLDSGYIVQGPKTAELEKRFAAACGVQHAVATSSGTTALHLALLAHDIGEGDEVITTPFTFIASANSILFTGATPVFVDIKPDTFNIDPEQVAAAVTPRTRAIMPVHLFGQMCDMEALQAIADKHNLIIVEDAAQAIGATYKGREAGSFGTGAFSLYATKNVMSAEGGMVTTDDEALAHRLRLLRNHGMEKRYHYEMLGYNFRMTDMHAALGLGQIDRLESFTQARRGNAAYFNEHITNERVTTPETAADREHAWHQYTIRFHGDRSAAIEKLREAGVGTGIFYPIPCHQHEYMQQIVGDLSFPVTEAAAREVISLPVHPQLSQADREKIVAEVNHL